MGCVTGSVRNRSLFFLFFLLSCSRGGGGSGEGALELVEINLLHGESRAVNLPLAFHFNKAIDLGSVHPTSIQIQALPAAVAGAPAPPEVQGEFFLGNGEETNTVVFQPLCPTTDNPQWGFTPGNEVSGVTYQVFLPGGEQDAVVTAMDGSRLGQSFSLQFTTLAPPAAPVQDPRPEGPPRLAATAELPTTLDLNLFAHPLEPLSLPLDQPVLEETIDSNAVTLIFEHPALDLVRIPAEVVLSENCTSLGGATLEILPIGPLPPDTPVQFFLSPDVTGLGGMQDSSGEPLLLHTAVVRTAARPQEDAILQTFDSVADMDPSPVSIFPLARWEKGKLEAAKVFGGSLSDLVIQIGENTTNGNKILFDTNGTSLKDNFGNPIFFPGGVIEVKRLDILNKGILEAFGPNPLIIRATEGINVERGGILRVSGQDAPDVLNVNTANNPAPFGEGRAGGGDGGFGSPQTTQSSPKGDDGNGPFNIPGAGAAGGHTAYGTTSYVDTRPGGGGGGNWGILEVLADGTYDTFCYGDERYCTKCGSCNAGCNGNSKSWNSNGENGSDGAKSSRQICIVKGDSVNQLDAVTNLCHAKGGERGFPVFTDSQPDNNFFGRKPVHQGSDLAILDGELPAFQGGQGGGGGGDNVINVNFPSGPKFAGADYKGGGGGGGAGVLLLQSLGPIRIIGDVQAEGGDGGFGEIHIRSNKDLQAAGSGGGGAGGHIIIESAQQIFFGKNADLSARGGNRSFGCGTLPGKSNGGDHCKGNQTAAKGGAGGKGLIQFHLPFDEENSVTCAGVTQPALKSNSLVFVGSDNQRYEILCERDLTLASGLPAGIRQGIVDSLDPAPQILIPNYGTRSIAQSDWMYMGWSSVQASPTFRFAGLESTTGDLESGFTRVLASGNGGILEQNPSSITLENAALANLIRSEPAILMEDAFVSDRTYAILGASVTGDTITLELDTSQGNLGVVETWSVERRFFATLVNGTSGAYPDSAGSRLLFQGADALEPGSLQPDPATLTAFSPDLSLINDDGEGKSRQLIRFRVLFDSNKQDGPLDPLLPVPGLEFLKIPYSF